MNLNVPRFDAPELVVGADDIRTYREVLESVSKCPIYKCKSNGNLL